MSHRKSDLGIPCREKSAKVVLGSVLKFPTGSSLKSITTTFSKKDIGATIALTL